ncbi:AGAP008130-PA-like protein [Anopheles sinensis]|uniref:Menin n=1 Tax=Anopheles sinensis TaxID=74873 RepID=A0A084W886_ANOSI|nr:AGAP008130-PA-like protein [Anopheles sinensis]
MTEFCDDVIKLFPLRAIPDVIKLFRQQLNNREEEPDLTLLSIVTGLIEHSLTTKVLESTSSSSTSANNNNIHSNNNNVEGGKNSAGSDPSGNFPIIKYDTVEGLYKRFKTVLAPIEKLLVKNTTDSKFANREIIKKVSDIIWNSLLRSSYKDRAHLQSLYSYLCGNKLDCFGVAFAVVAGCQMLGYRDVHLAISEDHVWVVFGKTGDETIEVTWHGKGAEDKRGQSVAPGVESQTWLYVAGNPVVCNRYMEVAAIVSAINPSLTATSACLEVADLQQQLLWLLYDMGHLKKYPMALGCLGELEEVEPTPGRKSCEELYNESVRSAQTYYRNHHVYPYTYQGGYYYRKNMYREAFASWADSSDVIRLYNYSRDDEEIYKEFLDIANELIPQVMKLESSGHSAKSILRDSTCFANLLRFYDGICKWEECSQTPILHIGWAKPLVATIAKFDHDIRSQVIIKCADQEPQAQHHQQHENGKNGSAETDKGAQALNNNNNNNNIVVKADTNVRNGSNGSVAKDDGNSSSMATALPKSLEAIVGKCGEKLLNPEFLLQGGGQPFTSEESTPSSDGDSNLVSASIGTDLLLSSGNGNGDEEQAVKLEKEKPLAKEKEDPEVDLEPKRPVIMLYSQKMKGLKDLLLTEKLNTNAISLQITAQSQVQVGGKKLRGSQLAQGVASLSGASGSLMSGDGTEGNTRPKRARRE